MPQNQDYVSGSEKNRIDLNDNYIKVKMYNIHTICKKLNKQNIDILKMDIEGSEFDVISGLKNKFEININQICLETHERFFRFGIIKLLRMNRILHRNGYLLVSIENDDYTYIRKELIEKNRKGHE